LFFFLSEHTVFNIEEANALAGLSLPFAHKFKLRQQLLPNLLHLCLEVGQKLDDLWGVYITNNRLIILRLLSLSRYLVEQCSKVRPV